MDSQSIRTLHMYHPPPTDKESGHRLRFYCFSPDSASWSPRFTASSVNSDQTLALYPCRPAPRWRVICSPKMCRGFLVFGDSPKYSLFWLVICVVEQTHFGWLSRDIPRISVASLTTFHRIHSEEADHHRDAKQNRKCRRDQRDDRNHRDITSFQHGITLNANHRNVA